MNKINFSDAQLKIVNSAAQKSLFALGVVLDVAFCVSSVKGYRELGTQIVQSSLNMKLGGRIPDKEKALKKQLYYLKRRGYISIKKTPKESIINFTSSGLARLKKLAGVTALVDKKAWDGKYWLVAADVPNKYRSQGTFFHLKLKQAGFYPLQRTIWVFPYEPTEFINEITKNLKIGKFVTAMRVDKLDNNESRVLDSYFKKLKII